MHRLGSIAQFGVRWGRELAIFEFFPTIFEPFNHSRRIIAFDSFIGYIEISEVDENLDQMSHANLAVSSDYKDF